MAVAGFKGHKIDMRRQLKHVGVCLHPRFLKLNNGDVHKLSFGEMDQITGCMLHLSDLPWFKNVEEKKRREVGVVRRFVNYLFQLMKDLLMATGTRDWHAGQSTCEKRQHDVHYL